uniref:Rho-GAP domain-containing protein n=1 Tax=Accipiter nisus TaxID=211598 RepID=A0A8B9N0N7_9AVES
MDVLNLSCVFGPTLVGHSSANPTPLAIMEDTPRQSKVVARLLSLPPDFWRGFMGTEQENLVPTPPCSAFLGTGEQGWLCPAVVVGTLPQCQRSGFTGMMEPRWAVDKSCTDSKG